MNLEVSRLNYRHLRYFWMTVRAGGLGAAAEQLHLTPQTLSGQIRLLEQALGKRLFRKVGRRLELTEDGRTALRHADAIFAIGRELEESFRDAPRDAVSAVRPFRIGIADAVPKTVAYRLLQPLIRPASGMRLSCRAGTLDGLLSDLSSHAIDLVLADAPMAAGAAPAFNHPLGRSGISFFAARSMRLGRDAALGSVLQRHPLLAPGPQTAVAARLRRWLERNRIAPAILGEFDDPALMKTFGQYGEGIFVAPTALEADVRRRYAVRSIGHTDEVFEEFVAISIERRVRHPGVVAITEIARKVFTDWR